MTTSKNTTTKTSETEPAPSKTAREIFEIEYAAGEGVRRERAAETRINAEAGDSFEQYNLGMSYSGGTGVEQNAAEALNWMRRSAEQGNADAQRWLGDGYRDGERGCPQDFVQAAALYRLSAEQGNDIGASMLARAYELGEGVPLDIAQAVAYYRRAAADGDDDAQENLERLCPEECERPVSLELGITRLLRENGPDIPKNIFHDGRYVSARKIVYVLDDLAERFGINAVTQEMSQQLREDVKPPSNTWTWRRWNSRWDALKAQCEACGHEQTEEEL